MYRHNRVWRYSLIVYTSFSFSFFKFIATLFFFLLFFINSIARMESLELNVIARNLRCLERKFQIPCLCAGDFNELTKGDEKLGGNRSSHNQMQLFRDAIDECSLIDLGYSGSKFTWRKHFANG